MPARRRNSRELASQTLEVIQFILSQPVLQLHLARRSRPNQRIDYILVIPWQKTILGR